MTFTVTVRRYSLVERLRAVYQLLFTEWGRP